MSVPMEAIRTLRHVQRIVEREIALRSEGRLLELAPRRRDEADARFRRAARLARRRLALARSLGLW